MGQIGFGTWKLSPDDTARVVAEALAAGFSHIDTAAAYANEAAVGEGIRASGVPRERLFISGKLWTSKRSYDAAIKAYKRTLRALGLDELDQYLIHWPAPPALYDDWRERNAETWGALETLCREGLVRSIGVCNFKPAHLAALLETADIPPGVNQIELHPGWTQRETVSFCQAKGIAVEAWSPLGNGLLLEHPTLVKIAKAHACGVAEVCLQWCLSRQALPITKTTSVQRMRANLNSAALSLSEAELAAIDAMPVCAFSGLDADTVTQFG